MPEREITPFEKGTLRAKRRTSDNPEYVETVDELLGDHDPDAEPKRGGYPILNAQAPSDRASYPILTKEK